MTWQNAWALGGLATLVLPVLIHLLSRTQAVVQRFPSLRFLDVSRLLPTRSPRITDVPLLLVRMGVFAAAASALAGPLFNSSSRTEAQNRTIARAVIVDTSRSTLSSTSFGARAVDSLISQAQRLAAEAQTSTLLQTANPASAISGATAWLGTQGGRGEIVLLSDFQASAVDSAALAHIPAQYGVKLVRTGLVAAAANDTTASAVRDRSLRSANTVVSVTADSTRTSAEWAAAVAPAVRPSVAPAVAPAAAGDTRDAGQGNGAAALTLVTAEGQQALAELARAAALQVAPSPMSDSARHVVIVYPGATTGAEIARNARAPSERWMGDFIARLVHSELFAQALASATDNSDTTVTAPLTVLGRNARGGVVVFGAERVVGDHRSVVLFARMPAGSAASAALIAAAQQAAAVRWPVAELEPLSLSDAALSALQRAPGTAGSASAGVRSEYATASASDARWFWILALVLLGVEAVMRSAKRSAKRDAALQDVQSLGGARDAQSLTEARDAQPLASSQ